MQVYHYFTIIIILAAAFGYFNQRFLKLPRTIGVMIIALLTSLGIVLAASYFPNLFVQTKAMILSIDFYTILMEVMLSFLLFAGSIHIKLNDIKSERVPIIALSTIGVLISTVIVGGMMYWLLKLFGLNISFINCLLFGALISPTDPIAVLGILKSANITKFLETKISGESLFNDGVAVVLFMAIYEISAVGFTNMEVSDIALLFLREAGGGILLGTALGSLGTYILKTIDNYSVEVMVTLAMVMGGYWLASALHISGPLSMVVAGIFIGNRGREIGMSSVTEEYIDKFWEMLDEILNAVLFLLIGLELLVIKFENIYILIGIIAIFVVLLARFISVGIPFFLLKKRVKFEQNSFPILVWGGIRGGISVALALLYLGITPGICLWPLLILLCCFPLFFKV